MAPFEKGALGQWRRRTWAEVPKHGLGLEVGTGTGANFPHYPPGARVVATELSIGMLDRAGEKPDRANTPLVVADVQALPFRDGTFHWVAETLVFCEVPDPTQGWSEVKRVLKLEGRLVMLEHVRPSGWLGRLADVLTAVTVPLWGEHYSRDAESYVREAGFEIERREWLWRDGVVLLVARPGDPAGYRGADGVIPGAR